MKKKDSSIRITSDSYAAVDFFKPGDYIVAAAGAGRPPPVDRPG